MRILVTGGAGFIGSHLVDRLLGDGHDVVVIDNCSTGHEANLAHLVTRPALTFLRGDVLNETLVAAVVDDVDLIYHLAAAVGVQHILDDPLWGIVTNTRGTEVVLKRAAASKTRVVFASTSEVYGKSDDVPFREDGDRVLGPTWTHRWSYSTAKALDEHLCFAHAERGLPVSIVRYFNVYGPRLDPAGYGSVIARFIDQALSGRVITVHGDGEQTRCFTFIDDAVEATVLAGTSDDALGKAFNVGSATENSINELARLIVQATGATVPIAHVPYRKAYGPGFADTLRRVPDVTRAAEILGWRADTLLTDGLARVLDEWGERT